MGYVKRKPKVLNDVQVIDPTPVWVGYDARSPTIKHFMNVDIAEAWYKEDPVNRSVKLKTTAGQLRQYDQKQMGISVWDR